MRRWPLCNIMKFSHPLSVHCMAVHWSDLDSLLNVNLKIYFVDPCQQSFQGNTYIMSHITHQNDWGKKVKKQKEFLEFIHILFTHAKRTKFHCMHVSLSRRQKEGRERQGQSDPYGYCGDERSFHLGWLDNGDFSLLGSISFSLRVYPRNYLA